MHHNNSGNFYTREVYAIPIPIGFIPIPIPIPVMSRMAIPMGMGFPWGFPLPCTPLVRIYTLQVFSAANRAGLINDAFNLAR